MSCKLRACRSKEIFRIYRKMHRRDAPRKCHDCLPMNANATNELPWIEAQNLVGTGSILCWQCRRVLSICRVVCHNDASYKRRLPEPINFVRSIYGRTTVFDFSWKDASIPTVGNGTGGGHFRRSFPSPQLPPEKLARKCTDDVLHGEVLGMKHNVTAHSNSSSTGVFHLSNT